MTAPSPTRTALCPVHGCGHLFDLTIKPIDPEALAGVFGFGVFSAAARSQQVAEYERQLDEHFRTHTTAEFVESIVKADRRAAAAESTAEDQHEKAEKLARRLSPLPGDFVKGWRDEGGSAQGTLLSNAEFKAGTPVGDLPTYYAAIKVEPSGDVVVVMRESLRGVEL